MRKVPLTYRGVRNYLQSKPRACEGVIVVSLLDVLKVIEEKLKQQREKLADIFAIQDGGVF